MGSVVLGIFDTREQAEQAALSLRDQGFHKDISIVAQKEQGTGETEEINMGGDDTAVEGITTGGVLGGIAGLAAGAGALAIPGIGPLVALGPDCRTALRGHNRRPGRRANRLGYP